jgi:hypothetical protein
MASYPRLLPIRQRLIARALDDVPAAVRRAVDAAVPEGTIKQGQRIAVTAGSRGISNVALITREVVNCIRRRGGEPFVVPAMGSHGGATAEGQAALLRDAFGISEETMGCPVLSSMEVVELGRTQERGLPVYVDEHVARADGVVVVNRVKAHTDYSGPHESGLFKMIAIGLGKRAQAESIHAFGAWGLRQLIPEVARAKIRLAPILGGIAILEDGYEQTAEIVGLPAEQIEEAEPKLLEQAKQYMARLPFAELDLLIVDWMGKEISGTGLDTNVIGRTRIEGEAEFDRPRIERIIVRGLTEATHGNGIGVGLADIITRRLHDAIDVRTTQINSLTSTFPLRAVIPVVAEHDQEALDLALYLLRRKPVEEVTIARIRDTLHLGSLLVSENLLDQVRQNETVEAVGEPDEIRFDAQHNLIPAEVGPAHEPRVRMRSPQAEPSPSPKGRGE